MGSRFKFTIWVLQCFHSGGRLRRQVVSNYPLDTMMSQVHRHSCKQWRLLRQMGKPKVKLTTRETVGVVSAG